MKRRDLLAATAIVPMIAKSGRAQSTGDRDALPLLRKMQTALGGSDRLASVRHLDWTVIAKTWNASGVAAPDTTRRIRWIRPNIFRKDQRAGKLFIIEFFDGTGGWEVVPDAGFLELKGRELEIVRKEARSFMLNLWLADRDARYQVSSGGDGIVRITASDVGVDILVDPASGLPVRSSAVDPSPSGTVTGNYQQVRQRAEVLEWQMVDGIRWPHKTVNFHDDVKRAEITTTSIKINSGMNRNVLSDRAPAI